MERRRNRAGGAPKLSGVKRDLLPCRRRAKVGGMTRSPCLFFLKFSSRGLPGRTGCCCGDWSSRGCRPLGNPAPEALMKVAGGKTVLGHTHRHSCERILRAPAERMTAWPRIFQDLIRPFRARGERGFFRRVRPRTVCPPATFDAPSLTRNPAIEI